MKRNILTIALCILAFSLGIGINNFAFSDINTAKVAYVDVNKLVAASKTIKSAQATREKDTAQMLQWYDKASAEIQKQETGEKRKELIKKYEAQLTQKKKSIKQAYANVLNKADKQMEEAISKKASELGYSLVFRRDALIVGGDDITSQVLPLVK